MIGFVIVSHSAKLAEGVCELASQVAQDRVNLAAAGGTGDEQHPIGTDAFKVLEAIESVYSEEGVIVLTDLGSAVLNAEAALELLDEAKRRHVQLCSAPLVEGTVAAVSQAAAGASVDEILREAERALAGKSAPAPAGPLPTEELRVTISNPLGLHARPAAQFVRLARRFRAQVTLENLSTHTGPFDAASINGMLQLGARRGHCIRMCAQGAEAREALAALAAFVRSGFDEQPRREPASPARPAAAIIAGAASGELVGIGASAGIAIGPLVRLRTQPFEMVPRVAEDPAAEWKRLLAAVAAAEEETRALREWARVHAGGEEAGIFDAQSLFLDDPGLLEAVSRLIHHERRDAASAWHDTVTQFAGRLCALEDSYLRERAGDMLDAGRRVLRRLGAMNAAAAASIREPSILAAHDLLPSEVHALDPAAVVGLCLEAGSASAHAAILIRAMGVPAVVGLGPGITSVPEGTMVALDGERGVVWVSPSAGRLAALEQRRRQWRAGRQAAQAGRLAPACLRDGKRISILANVNRDTEVSEALEYGAEGIGVLRTEFLFVDRSAAPGEDEQIATYRGIAAALGSRPLVIRTLDIGGDKRVPYLDIGEEANPFLGWRGIRLTLGRRDLLRTQIRSILRAGAGCPVEILFPMISTVDELREAKNVLAGVERELEREGTAFARGVPAGVMIEVPSAVMIADQLACEATRLSIGTNDLVQYAMAADRTNSRVAPIADPFQPAVLRMIRHTAEAGKRAGIRVDLCGEMAADPLATPLLIGLGIEELSVSAPLIPELKQAITRWTEAEAKAIARRALELDSSVAVREFLRRQ
jgi:phosphoenolpyruvate-protein phosphotransferase/dihydroxyacetone kinase phosphotransfer subunit